MSIICMKFICSGCGKIVESYYEWENYQLCYNCYKMYKEGKQEVKHKNIDENFKIPNFCPDCGIKIEQKLNFCPNCGLKFREKQNSIKLTTECSTCGNNITRYYEKEGIKYCEICYKIKKSKIESLEHIPKKPKTGEIKCPYCFKNFTPIKKLPTGRSRSDNILKGAIFLPWGVVSSLKSKPFVQCPYCKMKIPQG